MANPQQWTLGELAALLNGELHGPADLPIAHPAAATSDDPLGIAFAETADFLATAEASGVGALILPPDVASATKPYIQVASPREAFGRLLNLADRPLPLALGVHPTAIVDQSAVIAITATIGPYSVIERNVEIGDGAKVFPYCYVGENSVIGAGAILYPNATLYRDVTVGARTIVHSGAVLGADGFGFAWDGSRHVRVPQVGTVVIGDDVEVGAMSAIDRATVGETVIGAGTKLDNLIQIGHNTRLGEHVAIASQTGISGSSEIGDRVMMGGQCAISDHVTIAADVMLAGKSGVGQNITEPGAYFGSPAVPMSEGKRAFLLFPKLPELFKRMRKLEREVEEMKGDQK